MCFAYLLCLQYGKTALDFAESFGRKNVVAYLQAVLEQEHSTTGDPGTTSPSKESESPGESGHDG